MHFWFCVVLCRVNFILDADLAELVNELICNDIANIVFAGDSIMTSHMWSFGIHYESFYATTSHFVVTAKDSMEVVVIPRLQLKDAR